jgi:chorismate mutase
VRPKLDLITGRLLERIRDTRHVRSGPACVGRLVAAVVRTDVRHGLDSLHRRALNRAVESVC